MKFANDELVPSSVERTERKEFTNLQVACTRLQKRRATTKNQDIIMQTKYFINACIRTSWICNSNGIEVALYFSS